MKGLKHIIFFMVAAMALAGCSWFKHDDPEKETTYSKVMVLYSAGFNSLSSYLKSDIEDLKTGYLPYESDDKALIIVSHLAKQDVASQYRYQYSTPSYIIRLYKDKAQTPVMDTLKVIPATDLLVVPEVMDSALTYIGRNFKSDHYGLVLSSHGTGWLPVDYYTNPSKYTSQSSKGSRTAAARNFGSHGEAWTESELPGPKTKTFGQEYVQTGSTSATRTSYEMTIQDLAAAMPMHFDYMLFDACLMGCVEVAYELKDVTSYVGFSQAEVLADGFAYPNLTTRLLLPSSPDIKGVCEDYYAQYESQTGDYNSATFSLVDCDGLKTLSEVCKDIIDDHREALDAIDPDTVQRYYRENRHWFYDMKDIFAKAGMSSSEEGRLDAALQECVLYNECTPAFMPNSGGFEITTHCGFSMYLPKNGNTYLDDFYKTLAWNRAVGLVQ